MTKNCRVVRAAYARRVRDFLLRAPKEYVTAMGYDRDKQRFKRDVLAWRHCAARCPLARRA